MEAEWAPEPTDGKEKKYFPMLGSKP